MGILQGLNTLFPLKYVFRPDIYIGGYIELDRDDTGNFHCVTRERMYIKNICDNIESIFETSPIN